MAAIVFKRVGYTQGNLSDVETSTRRRGRTDRFQLGVLREGSDPARSVCTKRTKQVRGAAARSSGEEPRAKAQPRALACPPPAFTPRSEARSPLSFAALNSRGGPVTHGGGQEGWEGGSPFPLPGRDAGSALRPPGSHAVRVATSSVEDPRGTPGRAGFPFSVRGRVDLRGWLTAKGESGRISGFHGRLLRTRDKLPALPARSKGKPSQFA